MKGFSIIVCCYNSAKVIEKTLHAIAALHIPHKHEIEVIIVNNGCQDHTCSLVSATWDRLHAPHRLRIINEDKPGLSHARRKGIHAARYEYILFCDDDNRLSSDYVLTAAPILDKNPLVGVLGGLGIPDYESLPDYWSDDFYIYGSGPQAEASGIAPYVHGAGMIVRREALEKIENADMRFMLTDRKEEQLTSGGDHELCYAIRLAGYIIWYENKLTFRHFITTDRVNKAYCWKFIRESAPAIDVLEIYRYYLTHDTFRIDFYARQLKTFIFHTLKLYHSFLNRARYKNNKKIVFLEDFHIRFHKARIRSIYRSAFKYKRWAIQIADLKKRTQQH